ncbi:MAG: hypothetical protein RI885_387 [Actinomycetota bacterium]
MSDPWLPDATELTERDRITADDVSWAFREANRVSNDLDAVLARHLALGATDYDAMNHLMSSPDPLGPNTLARRLGITAASATELVDRLEEAGHVTRVRSTEDRRRVELHASPDSTERILGELRPLIAAFDEIASELDDAQRAAVAGYLRAISRATRSFVDGLGGTVR